MHKLYIPFIDQKYIIYTVGNTVAGIETNLHQDMTKVTNWCSTTRIFINKTKTTSMHLCTRQKIMNYKSILKIKIDDDDIENSQSKKVLRYIYMLD